MMKISDIWTLVYKDVEGSPVSFSYTSKKDAERALKSMQESNGTELIDENGNVDGYVELEWIYLLNSKLIESNNN